jgi:hypothetical protein
VFLTEKSVNSEQPPTCSLSVSRRYCLACVVPVGEEEVSRKDLGQRHVWQEFPQAVAELPVTPASLRPCLDAVLGARLWKGRRVTC